MVFHLLTWDTARRLAGPAAGLMALAVSGLAPHIVGTSALSLSHSIMVITAVAATTHATVMVVQSARIWAFVELGAAVTLGVLAKYNYFLFLIPFLGALVLDRSTRRAIVRPGLALSAAMVVAACTLPLVAAANDIAGTTERVAKLYEATKGWRSAIDIPGLGVDGAVFFVEALAGWAGLAVVVWMVARALDRRRDGAPPPTAPAPAPIHALGVAMVAGLVIFLVGVVAADVSLVRGRYLTPMLASLPVWLAVARPLGRSAPIVARAAGAIYLTVPIVFAGVCAGRSQSARLVMGQPRRTDPGERHDTGPHCWPRPFDLGEPGDRPRLAASHTRCTNRCCHRLERREARSTGRSGGANGRDARAGRARPQRRDATPRTFGPGPQVSTLRAGHAAAMIPRTRPVSLRNPSEFPTLARADAPEVDRQAMVEVDRIMEDDFGIGLIQMMENAGRALARLAQALLLDKPGRVLALAGRGGNGGGVLTAARRLAGWGTDVSVVTTSAAADFACVPARQLTIVNALGVPVGQRLPASADDYDLLLDGLVGYSLAGALRGGAAEAVAFVNARTSAHCISLDVPSGFDAATGLASEISVRPDAILTIAAPKKGLIDSYPDAPMFLADISVPDTVFERLAGRRFAPPADITRII